MVVGDRGRSQAKIEAYALFLCHSEPVRTPVRNLIFPGKISHQFENFRNDMRGKPIPLVGAGLAPPAAGLSPGRRRCEASRRWFRRRRRCETKRSDLGWRFSFFSHSFFCKKKKEWEKEKTCPLRWISFFPRGCGRCAGPSIFLVLGKKDTG